jgi:hypothetical protein
MKHPGGKLLDKTVSAINELELVNPIICAAALHDAASKINFLPAIALSMHVPIFTLGCPYAPRSLLRHEPLPIFE